MDIHQLSPELQALLRSPEAQQLRQLLSRGDSRSLDAAASAARSGDGNAARAALSPLRDNPEAAEALEAAIRGAVAKQQEEKRAKHKEAPAAGPATAATKAVNISADDFDDDDDIDV